MRTRWIGWMMGCVVLVVSIPALARQADSGDASAIRAVMAAQVTAWNRGDIDGFLQGYENSPQTIFIGSTIAHGYAPILERYRKTYVDKAQMGTLTFRELSIRLLPSSTHKVEYAIVTGRFHLDRTVKGANTKDDGVFSLVWHKDADGWKILLDHTS